jgi:hypothetical protein
MITFYGLQPSSFEGINFQCPDHFWHPLYAYLLLNFEDILPSESFSDSSSSQILITSESSVKIAHAIFEQNKSGELKTIEDQYVNYKNSLSDKFSKSSNDCAYCMGTGSRSDAFGIANNFHKTLLSYESYVTTNRLIGYCDNCDATGKVTTSNPPYDFTIKNTINFAYFLQSSGGFFCSYDMKEVAYE